MRRCERRGGGFESPRTPFFGEWFVALSLRERKAHLSRSERATRTLEPDGQATGCNPVEVGSIPTGVSCRATAPKGLIPRGGLRSMPPCNDFPRYASALLPSFSPPPSLSRPRRPQKTLRR